MSGKYTEAQAKATKNYLERKKLVEIKFRVPEEQRTYLQEKVKEMGYKSFNEFVIEALEEKIEKGSLQ